MSKEMTSERSFKRSVSVLWTLTIMQLKEKMDVSYLRSFQKTLFRVIFFLLEFVAIGAICYALFYVANLFKVFDVNTGQIPANVLITVFTLMMVLSIVFATVGLVQSLYLSRDNLVLLTFPATPALVFLSKLLVYYVYELKKNFFFLVPFFCAYGLFLGYPAYYFPWVIVFFVFIAAVPVLLAALLSMPALYVFQAIRKSKILQSVLIVALFAGLIALVLALISALPEKIDFLETGIPRKEIQNLTATIAKIALPITWLTKLIIGEPYMPHVNASGVHTTIPKLFTSSTAPLAIGVIFGIALLVVLCFLLSQPLFYKMASKPFEHTKKMKVKESKNEKVPVLFSAVKKEWLVALRDNTALVLFTQLVVLMPLAIAVLNGLYATMKRDVIGVQMTVAFNFLIVLLFMLSANIRLSSAYSKDGFSAYLNKVQPSTYGSLLFAKLTVNMAIGLLGVIVTTIVYSIYCDVSGVSYPLFAATSYLFFVAHLFWSGELDIMNPQYEQYATFSEQSNNPNENKSSLLTFAIGFLAALVLFLLALEGPTVAWIKLLIFSVVFTAFRIFSYFIKIKVYYKEK